MFTGLIETMGKVARVVPRGSLRQLTIEGDLPRDELQLGESVAVNGVCLTVTSITPRGFTADAIAETLAVTTLGDLRAGSPVNLERALRLGDRLGGHLVQGHVDGVARVIEAKRAGADYRLRIAHETLLAPYIAHKGSVTLEGVSLTVSALDAEAFEVALIPETLKRTTLSETRAGHRLNVEVDLLARYLERLARFDRDTDRSRGD